MLRDKLSILVVGKRGLNLGQAPAEAHREEKSHGHSVVLGVKYSLFLLVCLLCACMHAFMHLGYSAVIHMLHCSHVTEVKEA